MTARRDDWKPATLTLTDPDTPEDASVVDLGWEPDFQAGYVIGTSEALTAAASSVRAVGEALADEIAMAYLDAPTRSGSRKNRGAEAVAMRDAIVDVVAGLADELDAWAQRPDAEPIASSARSAAEATLLDLEVGFTTRGGRGHPPRGRRSSYLRSARVPLGTFLTSSLSVLETVCLHTEGGTSPGTLERAQKRAVADLKALRKWGVIDEKTRLHVTKLALQSTTRLELDELEAAIDAKMGAAYRDDITDIRRAAKDKGVELPHATLPG